MKVPRSLVLAFQSLALLLLCLPPVFAQPLTPLPPKSHTEMRGLWVVRNSLASPAQIAHVVATARSHHFNALFVQVRGRGDAFYQSSLEPRAEELAAQPFSFDPLAEVIRQGHAAGLQVHAWMNTCYVWGAGRKPYSKSHVVNQHPDWLARDAHGHYTLKSVKECEGAFLTPAHPAARQHIHDVFLDVARRYDIDGIHFDYVRYPNSGYDYSEAALYWFRVWMRPSLTAKEITKIDRRARTDRLIYPHLFASQWQQFRRQQVTDMVAQISQDVKAIKPWVVVSAAVFADSQDALNARGQDWKTWLQRGYLDAVIPMAYGADTAKVAAQIADAVACARVSGRYAYAGLGSWHIPVGSTVAKINAARALGAQGSVLFSYGGITHDGASTAYLDKVDAGCYPDVANAPIMPWLGAKPNTQSAAVTAQEKGEANRRSS